MESCQLHKQGSCFGILCCKLGAKNPAHTGRDGMGGDLAVVVHCYKWLLSIIMRTQATH